MPTIAPHISQIALRLRTAVALAATAGACSVGVAQAEGQPPFPPPVPPAATCDQHPGTTLRQSGSLIVYGTAAGTSPLGQTRTRYWVCTLPSGTSTPLGARATGGRYPPNATMRRVTIAGSFVAAIESSGAGTAASCVAHDGHFCQRPVQGIVLVDGRRGGSSFSDIHENVGRLLVGSAGRTGATVWTQSAGRGRITISSEAMTTYARGTAGGGGTVTTGAIDPDSLSLHGLRLRYVEHGRLHSVNLGRALGPPPRLGRLRGNA